MQNLFAVKLIILLLEHSITFIIRIINSIKQIQRKHLMTFDKTENRQIIT